MSKKKSILLIAVLLICCSLSGICASAETGAVKKSAQTKTNSKKKEKKKKKKDDPARPGWHTKANGKKYYVKSDGKRAVGWVKIDNKYYYFKANGILTSKTGWVQNKGFTYYIRKDRIRCESCLFAIDGKYYYFDQAGRLVTNKRAYALGKRYYNIDSNGVAEQISALEAQCELEAQKFINKHTKTTMSQQEKLRACFRYLLAYMRYRPQAPNWSEFKVKEWYYQKAVKTFRSPTLDGNCYSFACTVAACAKELGYKPTVVVITADHGFVMIDGKYYDNMKGGLFGSAVPSCPGYQVYTKAEF